MTWGFIFFQFYVGFKFFFIHSFRSVGMAGKAKNTDGDIYIYMKHKEEEKDRGVCCSEDD